MVWHKLLHYIKPRRWALAISLVVVVLFASLVVLAVAFLPRSGDPGPIASTTCGKVRGRETTTPHGPVSEFLYIPYAPAPVGERRWQHSEELSGSACWEGVYPAYEERGIMCVQAWYVPVKGQEDCLYLSVKTPDMAGTLPVVVWIHGGGLQYGFAEDVGYSGDAEFTADINTVVVNINYRLDLLGFLSLPDLWEDGESYGNFGIYDSLVALQWVQDNIANFGGDKNQVTIMGESSGGTIILALVAAPKAVGLFTKAISMSAPAYWNSTYQDAHNRRPDFLAFVGCENYTTSLERRTCLKGLDVEVLVNASTEANRGWGWYDFPMSAGILGEGMDYNVKEPFVLPNYPQEISAQHRNQTVQLVLANLAQETGYWTIIQGYNVLYNWTAAEGLLEKRLQHFLGYENSTLLQAIEEKYTFREDGEDWWPQIAWDTLTTDIRATCPSNDLAEVLNSSPYLEVFRLYIEHRPSETMGHDWDAWHGWDTEAMFNFKYFLHKYYNHTTEHDHALKRQLRTLVSDLAHNRTGQWAPSNIYIRNTEPWTEFSVEIPQQDLCTFWYDNGFQYWGWQN